MSLLASETQTKVSGCRTALQAVEEHLRPLIGKDPKDVNRKLASLESAELKVALAYTVASVYFSGLHTQGVDPASHPIQQELGRIQKYFKKVRTAKDEVVEQQEAKSRRRIDVEAANRLVQHYALASEAHSARRAQAADDMAGAASAVPRPQSSFAAGGAADRVRATLARRPGPASAAVAAATSETVDLTEPEEGQPQAEVADIALRPPAKRRWLGDGAEEAQGQTEVAHASGAAEASRRRKKKKRRAAAQ